jgi:hypothetical protein
MPNTKPIISVVKGCNSPLLHPQHILQHVEQPCSYISAFVVIGMSSMAWIAAFFSSFVSKFSLELLKHMLLF